MKRSVFSENVFARIGAVTLASTLFLVCSLFYYLAYRVVDADNDAKAITSRLTSQAVVDKIDRNFYERFGDVQAYAYNQLARQTLDSGAATPAVQQFLNTMTAYYVLYDLMMICDLNGKVLVTNTTDKAGNPIDPSPAFARSYANTDWFKACTTGNGPEGGAWYSDFMTNRDVARIYGSDGYGMAFAAPIRDEHGKLLGVWYNFASWREVTQSIRAEAEAELRKTDPDAHILLTNAAGHLIDATDGQLVRDQIQFTEAAHDASEARILDSRGLDLNAFVSGWATARGAYTYKGNAWKAATLLSRSAIGWATFFSGDLLPVILVTLLLISSLGLYIYLYFSKEIIRKIDRVKDNLEALAVGKLVEAPGATGHNEIARMTRSLSHLVDSLKQKAAFADEIATGNLETALPGISGHDVLGNSLVNMRDQLKKVAEEDRRRNWTTQGLATFGEIMRSGKEFDALCSSVLAKAVQYLRATQGALFLTRPDESGNVTLALTACYAYNRKKYLEKVVQPGQGLVGQAYLEGEIIYLTEVPRDYASITSGLGEAGPGSILIVPLKVNGSIEGVLELAAFGPYEPFEIGFAVKLAEDIAATLATVRTAERTRQLLEQSQAQAEEMRAQEEEMLQNMEEMRATQEEFHRTEREYRQQVTALQRTVTDLEARLQNSQPVESLRTPAKEELTVIA
jgi:methyl-accepting chemotaxis protein